MITHIKDKNLFETLTVTFGLHPSPTTYTWGDYDGALCRSIAFGWLRPKNQTHKIYKDTKQIRDHNHLNLQHQAGEYWTKLFKTIDDILRNI